MGSRNLVAWLPWWCISTEFNCQSNTGDWGSIPGLGTEWQPTPVFLPGESHGQRILVGYSPGGEGVSKESDTAERLNHHHRPSGHVENFSKNVRPHPWLHLKIPLPGTVVVSLDHTLDSPGSCLFLPDDSFDVQAPSQTNQTRRVKLEGRTPYTAGGCPRPQG